MGEQYEILWKKNSDKEAVILRVYGNTACVTLPGELGGCRVGGLAPYCFSHARHIPKGEYFLTHVEMENGSQKERIAVVGNEGAGEHFMEFPPGMTEIAGDLVEEVRLPDTLLELGECAFYNCKKLKKMEIGTKLQHIGSDAFMNTLDFHHILLKCESGEKSGLKQILSQISSDMEVVFWGEKGVWAVLLYPEYYESYDEIAPAHLFGRNIAGEGFRARQRFREGVPEFLGYDSIFPKACAEESERTLCKIALNRLMYPWGLTEENKGMYKDYLSKHIPGISKEMVKERNLFVLQFLYDSGLLSWDYLGEVISYAAEAQWAEGAAALMAFKSSLGRVGKKKRYEFE